MLTHVLNGGVVFASPMPSVRPATKGHIAVLLAVLAALKAADYWVTRYETTNERRGFVQGATYAVVHAQLPALMLLMLIALLTAGLYLATIRRASWRLPLIASGLWFVVLIAGGLVYPALVQSLVVNPNQQSREAPYIDRNVQATREAIGINTDDVQVQTVEFGPLTPPTSRAISTRCATCGCSTRARCCRASASTGAWRPACRSTTSTSTATRSTASCSRCSSPPASSTSRAAPTRAGRVATSSTPAGAGWSWRRSGGCSRATSPTTRPSSSSGPSCTSAPA